MGTVPVTNGACPAGMSLFQTKCYSKPAGLYTHDGCLAKCQTLNPPARLLCIESAVENAYIYSSFTSGLWIGISDSAKEGTFVWPTLCPSTYRNFQPNEPSGNQYSNYVIMTPDGQWDDVTNSDTNLCMCEIYAIAVPSANPTLSPSAKPTLSSRPTAQPSSQPSTQPTRQPTSQPSTQPSIHPTSQPSEQPSGQPSGQPSSHPSRQPISEPTSQPSVQPSGQPTTQPTTHPSAQPSAQPSGHPSSQPSHTPSGQPSRQPFGTPTGQPSAQPTRQPSSEPTSKPSSQPTGRPSGQPSREPSTQPSPQPSSKPSALPTARPSCVPSSQPSVQSSIQPSKQPTGQPTVRPTCSVHPTGVNASPTSVPTSLPSSYPTNRPSAQPSTRQGSHPSAVPSSQPTVFPSTQPTNAPRSQPTSRPSSRPSAHPSAAPSARPRAPPTARPSGQSSIMPSVQPTEQPSLRPSVNPSSRPSSQPTARPSGQPTFSPSCRPSAQPSSQPTSQPSGQPTSQPSSQPSRQPSGQSSRQPTSQPTGQPSTQPSSQPASQPTSQPSSQPTSQPTSQPSTPPSSRPSSQPSGQPSRQPWCQPSSQPSKRPSGQPTSAPSTTGEWTSVANGSALFSSLANLNGSVWACGGVGMNRGSACVVADVLTGQSTSQYEFTWDVITSVTADPESSSVVVSGRIVVSSSVSSAIARCTMINARLGCDVKTLPSIELVDASYNAYARRVVFVSQSAYRAAVTLYSTQTNTIANYVYTTPSMSSVVLHKVRCPPSFVGSFVVGTSVGSGVIATKSIFAGWLRSDTGQMAAAIGITPVSGSIVSTAGLVNAMALEATGPDSFIAGGLELSDRAGVHAYVVRVNALYRTVQFAVRFHTTVHGARRTLSTAAYAHVRAVVLTVGALYALVDVAETTTNRTSMCVLQLSTSTGDIIRQVHVSAPDADLHCTDITSTDVYLVLACGIQRGTTQQSVLIAANTNLAFVQLPAGFTRHSEPLFYAESVSMKATTVVMSTATASVTVTASSTTTSESVPSRQPSTAPSRRPSTLPTSVPSSQPSSSPTASPTMSAHPTSQPSTSGPTGTAKPTVVITARPSAVPTPPTSAVPTVSPSCAPTAPPTALPSSGQPSVRPSVAPTVVASCSPSARPSRTPSARPSTTAPTVSSTLPPTSVNASADTRGSGTSAFVIGASSAGGVCFALCGLYVLYRRRNNRKHKRPTKGRNTVHFVVSGDISTPDLPPVPVIMEPVSQWQAKPDPKFRDFHLSESDVESVHSKALHKRRKTNESIADSSSLAISSLHSSEISDLNSGSSSNKTENQKNENVFFVSSTYDDISESGREHYRSSESSRLSNENDSEI